MTDAMYDAYKDIRYINWHTKEISINCEKCGKPFSTEIEVINWKEEEPKTKICESCLKHMVKTANKRISTEAAKKSKDNSAFYASQYSVR